MGDRGAHPGRDVPPERRVAWLLTLAGQHRHAFEQRRRLNTADVRLVWLLSQRPRTLAEIADALSLEQSTVNRQVNAAIAGGLLHRYRESGRSAALVAPTDHGRESVEQDVGTALALYGAALDELGDDQDRFLDLLDTFVEAFGRVLHDASDGSGPADTDPARR